MDGRAFLTRRELLVLPCAYHLMAEVSSAGGPENIAFPLEGIQGTVTPPELFFVREHFVPTQISLRDWRLHIEGNVAHPLELRFADLLESPSKEVEAVLECAGNLAGGSAVSNAVWEGVGIAELLSQAGIARNSQAVLLEGRFRSTAGGIAPASLLPGCTHREMLAPGKSGCIQAQRQVFATP